MDAIVEALVSEIRKREKDGGRVIVAIDGRCASGKTTLGMRLKERLDCSLFHMDDYFLRPEQRTPARLATPGENVDHERFLAEVLMPLREGKAVCYRAYDCMTGVMREPVQIMPGNITVIEGSYSCHESLLPHYDLTVFLTVDPDEQINRIAKRNGPERAEKFRSLWIPLEEAYFSAFSLEERCDLSFKT